MIPALKRRIAVVASLAVCGIVAGCAVGPDYKKPQAVTGTEVPATFAGSEAVRWKEARPAASFPKGEWWKIFDDAELNRLESLAAESNPNLALAASRLEQARATYGIARADYFPNANLNSSFTRQRASANEFDAGKPVGIGRTHNLFSTSLGASWEPDLWGRVRRQTEAAGTALESAQDDYGAAQLAMQAEVAVTYAALCSLNEELKLLETNVEAFKKALQLTQNRRKGGIASDLDVAQAETQLKGTEAQVADIQLQISKTLNGIAILCGQVPGRFSVKVRSLDVDPAIAAWPEVLPSELLERRPDIASAERKMAGANARIGLAKTAFYPRIQFRGLAGFESINAGTWFDWPSRFWSFGPSATVPVFAGGRNKAGLQLAKAEYDAAVAEYRQTVLRAFGEVEDVLASQRLLGKELEAEVAALAAARKTLEIANNRYRSGLVTYLEVATAQANALNHERTVVRVRAARLIEGAALIKAVGGGWVNSGMSGQAAR